MRDKVPKTVSFSEIACSWPSILKLLQCMPLAVFEILWHRDLVKAVSNVDRYHVVTMCVFMVTIIGTPGFMPFGVELDVWVP
jgi:hypothetical protein